MRNFFSKLSIFPRKDDLMQVGQGSGSNENTGMFSSNRATMMFARLAFAGTVFMAMVLFTMGSDNPLNPCGNIAHAQSTICNVADNHSFNAGTTHNDDGGATASDDFRVETDTNANAIDTDSANNRVAFGQDASLSTLPFQVVGAAGFGSTVSITGSLALLGGLIVDLPITEGGTGSSTASAARTALDVDQAGTDNSTAVTLAGTPDYITISGQVLTRNLIDLAADVSGDLPITEGGTGSSSASDARTALGLAIGSDVQAWDDDLDTIAALVEADSEFIVGTGSGWTIENGSVARTSLGLGSLAIQSTIDNGDWSGTDLSVANGGTGVSTFTDHGVLIGSGTGAVSVTATGSSGEVLTSNGSGSDPTFQAAGGGGGITEADKWRVTTSFTGDASPISSNWEQVDGDGFGLIGTGMSQSSGKFTFPSTGFWLITITHQIKTTNATDASMEAKLAVTLNNSSFSAATTIFQEGSSTNVFTTANANHVLDVTSTSNVKVQMEIVGMGTNTTEGDSNTSKTSITFIRLGDT